jgi:hypothetical protein
MKDKETATFQDFMIMTQGDLRKLGLEEVGYIKKYQTRGEIAFVLHAADGTALAVQNDAEAARISADHQSIDIVSVH